MRNATEVFALRKAYWSNGYRPVPIYNGQKRPRGDGWRAEALQDPPVWADRWPENSALSTGVVTGELTAVDVDVLIQLVTDRVVWEIEQIVSPTPLVRIGLAPKILLAFRCEDPFRKLSTGAFIMPDGSEAKVEILALGQQFVADGIHPDTSRPYFWPSGSPERVPLDDVPTIRLEQAQSIIGRTAQLLIANGGVEKARRRHHKGRGADQLAGGRADNFFDNANTMALRDLAAWVRALFPRAVYQPATGAWRVTSKDRGRPDLQEDISFHPDGIQDFGLEQGLTAIDVVIAHGRATDAAAAAHWLCDRLGIEPATLGWHEGCRQAEPPPGHVRPTTQGRAASPNGADRPNDQLKSDRTKATPGDGHSAAEEETTILPPEFSENALARLFTERHVGALLYVHEWGKWLRWDDHRWQADHAVSVFDKARTICAEQGAIAAAVLKRSGAKVASAINKAAAVAAIERLARHHHRHVRPSHVFDADPLLLNASTTATRLKGDT